ncbi:hypothetical protein scyTo_0020137, partial [Scyliorhinus torazame]|nr:hypothetical protein [Scyliorhinus torazame]
VWNSEVFLAGNPWHQRTEHCLRRTRDQSPGAHSSHLGSVPDVMSPSPP